METTSTNLQFIPQAPCEVSPPSNFLTQYGIIPASSDFGAILPYISEAIPAFVPPILFALGKPTMGQGLARFVGAPTQGVTGFMASTVAHSALTYFFSSVTAYLDGQYEASITQQIFDPSRFVPINLGGGTRTDGWEGIHLPSELTDMLPSPMTDALEGALFPTSKFSQDATEELAHSLVEPLHLHLEKAWNEWKAKGITSNYFGEQALQTVIEMSQKEITQKKLAYRLGKLKDQITENKKLYTHSQISKTECESLLERIEEIQQRGLHPEANFEPQVETGIILGGRIHFEGDDPGAEAGDLEASIENDLELLKAYANKLSGNKNLNQEEQIQILRGHIDSLKNLIEETQEKHAGLSVEDKLLTRSSLQASGEHAECRETNGHILGSQDPEATKEFHKVQAEMVARENNDGGRVKELKAQIEAYEPPSFLSHLSNIMHINAMALRIMNFFKNQARKNEEYTKLECLYNQRTNITHV